MRLFPAAEFKKELERRGCRYIGKLAFGYEWQAPDGRSFLVPIPEEIIGNDVDAHPDWMLDDLINKHELPAAPDAGDVTE